MIIRKVSQKMKVGDIVMSNYIILHPKILFKQYLVNKLFEINFVV